MFIFADPSELKSNSLFPDGISVLPCPGLEAETGVDFVISKLPISPVSALSLHIKSRSIFCQRKSGYDACNFDQIWLEIARIQKCHIPINQAFVLPIGIFRPSSDGLLRIDGKRPLENNEKLTYLTYLKQEAEWGYSGVSVRRLNDESELSLFIQAQMDELMRVEGRDNKKEVWTKGSDWEYTDPWQDVKEIDDWRNLFLSGLKGFGPKTAKNVQVYIQDHIDHVWENGYYVLRILTEENEKGKPKHNIPGWGDEKRKRLREIMGLQKGFNIGLEEVELPRPYTAGWTAALDAFKYLVEEKKKSGPQAWMQLYNEEIPF